MSGTGDEDRPARVLLTGATGYLGHRLVPLAAERAAVVATARRPPAEATTVRWIPLDLSGPNAAAAVARLVAAVDPSAIIHAAAVNPGGDDELMAAVNVGGSAVVATAAAEVGARLVHVSSDTVLAGRSEEAPYPDTAPTNPVNRYGETKAAAEEAVLTHCPGAAVVRTSLIYGTALMDRGTAGFAERLAGGGRLELFADVLRQPVWVDALAEALLDLALRHRAETGVMNLAGRDVVTREAFGRRMLAYWGIDGGDRIAGVPAEGRPGVPRDLRLRLDRAKALGLPTPGVGDVLGQTG
jgi:dTDP-4-dehydrorhamnose reductase